MFEEVFKKLNLDFKHTVLNISERDLKSTINFLRNDFFIGANVTLPHKENVIKFIDEIDEESKLIGAINTIANKNGKLFGYNTDIFGITETLNPYSKKIKKVLILGSGGAARSAITAIFKYFNIDEIEIFNRTKSKAENLKFEFEKKFIGKKIIILNDVKKSNANLIINSTSVGMNPKFDAMPLPNDFNFSNEQIIFDIIYNPLDTKLLQSAKKMGATTISGVEMFINQAKKSFEIWFEKTFPADFAMEIVLKNLKKNGIK